MAIEKDAEKILEEDKVDMVVMGSKVSSTSSTIIEIKDNKLVLIREGAISFEDIEKTLYRGN